MHAILTADERTVDQARLRLQEMTHTALKWDAIFSKRVRQSVFSYEKEQVYDLYFPLQRAAYDTVYLHASVPLYRSSTSFDLLARAMNAVADGGRLFVEQELLCELESEGRLDRAGLDMALGPPDETHDHFLVYRAKKRRVPEDKSILGWYYNQRGNIVEANVTGGLMVGKSAEMASAVMRRLLYPGAPLDLAPKRLPRKIISDIVAQVRASPVAPQPVDIAAEKLEGISYAWNWEVHGAKFKQYQESWENYLIPGTLYKAAGIGALLKRSYPDRKDLSFLEHGGNAGLLTAQLLLDLPEMLSLAVCCEIDVVPLINANHLFNHYEDRLLDKMYVWNAACDGFSYDRQFSVIAFVHMLLYARRDLLPQTLSAAWEALEPGGMLLVLENTHPPTLLNGTDGDIMFHVEELEAYLDAFGAVQRAFPSSGAPATAEDGKRHPLIRYVRKPA
ncbi:hypothetical protein [Eleftheria terrae]|uniref:hypothetical protein n=1 Tax=Eleftheria terrae TaxID=1597781 RepID=UPI00263A504F|nr:hypothetical protein [Eleftheria terrae]WKB51084.1 hypothetical protein N7L95_14835 [Eleftheria terrae]